MDYNEEPVKYCSHCLWIGGVVEVGETEICPCCGSTRFSEVTIEEWDKMFRNRYKQGSYLNIKYDNLRGVELYKRIIQTEPRTL